jgi:ankyrin repeat protein
MSLRSLPLLALLLTLTSAPPAADAPLADAVERQDTAAVGRLLDTGVAVDQPQADGTTALHWAAQHEDVATAKQLLERGADVKAANRYGVTPLALACLNGHGELIERLLAAGADANSALRGGETVLMVAARTGKLPAVQALLKAGANVHAAERKGQSAVMWAAAEGHADVVKVLIDAGADFRQALPSGFTPLMFAAREGRLDVVRVLLTAGANVNEVTVAKPATPRATNVGTGPLILAVENAHFELAAALLEAGADPNDQRSGFSPLHLLTVVRKPPRGDGEEGDPPPRGSGTLSSLDFVRVAVQHGADVNLKLKKGISGRGILSRVGATPFLLAASTADLPLMTRLVELGADPLTPNAEHATPLMAAAGLGCRAPGEEAGTEEESVEAVKYCLARGADINAVDDSGETAMHGAAYKNLPAVVQLLADRGADPAVWNRPNKHGWSPLVIAHGHRVGNFKPSPDTIAAIRKVLLAAGITPPDNPKPLKAQKTY